MLISNGCDDSFLTSGFFSSFLGSTTGGGGRKNGLELPDDVETDSFGGCGVAIGEGAVAGAGVLAGVAEALLANGLYE